MYVKISLFFNEFYVFVCAVQLTSEIVEETQQKSFGPIKQLYKETKADK